MKYSILLAASAALFAAPAGAQNASGSFGVGITGGTLGIGPEVDYRWDKIGIRANATFLSLGRNVETDDVEYDGDLKLRSFGAMLDYYPFGGGFRITPGLRISRNRVTLEAAPTANVEIGDEIYTPAEIGTLSGEVRAKRLAPSLTIGWTSNRSSGLYFGLDAGALFQGAPRVRKLTTTGMLNDPALQADLQAEAAEIEDDIDRFKVYPILQLGLGFRFGGRAAPEAYVAPAPAPVPPAAPATQTCADGAVILATDTCPVPPPPPPAPKPGERG